MADPDSFYATAERRIEWLTLALGAGGAVFAAAGWGWRAGAGVGVGALLMWLNFRWLKPGVGALVSVSAAQADSKQVRVPRSVYMKFFGRFALLLFVVYVILSRALLPVTALLAGLFALVAAVMLEMIYDLACGRRGKETHT
jgi:hypothetical protein